MRTASFPHAEHVGCPAATIDGIPVESAIFGETIEVPCPAGRHEGVMNVTCSATGVWETPATLCRGSLRGVSSLVPYTCAEETVEGISWPLTNAGTQATVSCVLKNPQLRGNITRECSIAGEWGNPAEACYSGAPKDFAYAVSVVTVPRQVEIPAMTPVPIAGVERFEAVDALPFGLEIDAATGVISGAPLQVAASRSYRIVAKNAQGQAETQVTVTVLDNTCPADGAWHAAFNGQEQKTKCPFLGKESRKCALDPKTNMVQWEKVNSQCVMMVLIVVAVVVVVVLILVLLIVLRR